MCSNQSQTFQVYLKKYLKCVSNLALLLDYDGTLTPIVAHPDLAKIPPETKSILERLSRRPNVFIAIISGRAASSVKELVGLDNVTYAGNHGLEVLYPDGSNYRHELPKDFNDQVSKLIGKLAAEVVKDGSWIENKGASLTFHFRAVPENVKSQIERSAEKIIQEANFAVGKAHCALEARPKVDWNKGKVALLLLNKRYGDKWNEQAKVIFAGDDTTDEDAMKALKGNAATFRIAYSDNVDTFADKILASTENVMELLQIVENHVKL